MAIDDEIQYPDDDELDAALAGIEDDDLDLFDEGLEPEEEF